MTAATDTAPASKAELIRGIRRWELVALVLNAIIGAGIFGLPSKVFALSGSWVLLAYVVCALLVVMMMLCFAEVSSRFSTTGGPYVYAQHAFGPAVGFEIGWLLWLARFTAFAALCNSWLDYLSFFRPELTAGVWRSVAITVIVVILTVVNLIGIRRASMFNNIFTVGKLSALLIFVSVGLFFIRPENFSFVPGPEFTSFSGSVLLLVFAFSGFEMAVIPAGETRDPQKHLPFALITGIGIIVALYLLIQVVSIGTLPELATSTRPLADAAARFMGPAGAALIVAGALVSITGTLNTIVLVGPRLLFAMGEQGQLPRIFAATHPRFKTPWFAILVSSVAMLVLTLQGSFITSLTISTVIRLVVYAVTCISLPVLRAKKAAPRAEFMIPGGAFLSIAVLILCTWLVITSAWKDVRLTLFAAIAGLVMFLLFNYKTIAAERNKS